MIMMMTMIMIMMMLMTWQSSREVSLSLASTITQWVGTPHQDSANQVRGIYT
jgi:cytochrome oxidase assembly protein ShyY1